MVIIFYTFFTVNPFCGIVVTGLQRLQHLTTQAEKLFFAGVKVGVSLKIKPSARLKQTEGKTLSSSTADLMQLNRVQQRCGYRCMFMIVSKGV
jgi:hypothetical protein